VADDSAFRLCSSCRKPIPYLSAYYACSVSTCNRKRTGLYFCSVACWDAHLPEARHREAWAEERRAPSREEAAREDAGDDHIGATPGAGADAPARQRERIEGGLSREGDPRRAAASVAATPSIPATASEVAPKRTVVTAAPPQPRSYAMGGREDSEGGSGEVAREVLVVVSKLKAYVRAASGMNTSDGVFEVLSDHLRRLCDAAARVSAREGRKTVMDRDFKAVLSDWDD